MCRILTICALSLSLSFIANSQTITDTQTICKGSPIPADYSIVGETDSKNCANQAWIIRKKFNPSKDGKAMEKKPAPKMAQGGESVNSNSVDKEGEKQWKSLYQWQLFTPPTKDFSVLTPGKPFQKTSLENGSTYNFYFTLADRIVYFFASGVGTKPLRGNFIKEGDEAVKDIFEMLKELGVGGDLFFDRKINTNGFVGKQFKNISSVVPCLFRYYAKGKRVYMIAVVGSDDKDVHVNKFLTSFKLAR